jgi:hypothetical protein
MILVLEGQSICSQVVLTPGSRGLMYLTFGSGIYNINNRYFHSRNRCYIMGTTDSAKNYTCTERLISACTIPDIEMSGCKGKVPPAPEARGENIRLHVLALEEKSIYSLEYQHQGE